MAKLVIAIEGAPRVYPLGDQPISLGREPENEIQLEWPDVSRKHCRIEPLPQGGYRVLDLGSKNGTFLNGRPVTAMALEYDDRIRVGEATVIYVDDETDPAEALSRGAEDGYLQFPAASGWKLSQVVGEGDSDSSDHPTWRGQRRQPPTGPHTRASNRSYLKERLVRLGLLSQNIASELDLSRLMATILDEVLDFTGFERGLLLMSQEESDRLQPVLGRNMDHEHLAEAERRFSRGLVEEALSERRIVFRAGIQGTDSSFSARDSVVSMGLECALCIPLNVPLRIAGRPTDEERRRTRRKRRILGVIYLDSTFPIRKLDEADLRLLEAVAAQAAIALQNARLHYQATTDPLTNLSNRGFITQAFDEELRYAREHGDPLGVMLLDLDHFKRINDTYGHQVGDEVLKRVAHRLRRTIRRDDYAGRWGGEEFIVLLPGEGQAGARIVADKVAEAIRARPIGQAEVTVTTSIGVAVYPEHGDTVALLVKRADQALYAAKHAGRNRTEVFSPEMDRTDHRSDPVGGIFYADPVHTHRNLTAIFDTIEVLRSNQEPVEILRRTLDNVCDLTRARRALLIMRGEADEVRATLGRGAGGRELEAAGMAEFSRSAVRTALEENRSLCVLEAGDEEALRLASSSFDKLGLSSVMVVPLLVGEHPVGVLYADDTTARREFGHMDLSHLEVISHQLALSLAANPALHAAAAGRRREDLDETTRLKRELAQLRAELEALKEETGKHPRPPA